MRRFAPAFLLSVAACAPHAGRVGGERFVAEIPEGINEWWFSVSPGGRSAAYVERRGSDAYLTVDGRRIGPFP